jgi:hypothetical protein
MGFQRILLKNQDMIGSEDEQNLLNKIIQFLHENTNTGTD